MNEVTEPRQKNEDKKKQNKINDNRIMTVDIFTLTWISHNSFPECTALLMLKGYLFQHCSYEPKKD